MTEQQKQSLIEELRVASDRLTAASNQLSEAIAYTRNIVQRTQTVLDREINPQLDLSEQFGQLIKLKSDDSPIRCPKCRATHYPVVWKNNGACPSCGWAP